MTSGVKQATIVIDGNVQFVGFRSHIQELASKHNLAGLVYNDIREGNVKFICEGEVPMINELVEEISKYPYINRVDVKDEVLLPKPVGRVVEDIERDTFDRIDMGVKHLGSIDSRLDTIDLHVASMDDTLGKNTGILKENTGIMRENTDILKENTGIIRENTDILKENTGIMRENTDILKENTGVLKENSSLLKGIKEILHKIAEK